MKKLLGSTKALIVFFIIFNSLSSYADGDDGVIFKRWFETKNKGISSVKFQQYNDLCGSCHFPYQPGLLPGISWEKIMRNLDSHFGQSIQMTQVEIRTILRYVLDNSAGHVNDEISNKILQSLRYEPIPVRITQTPFLLSKHKQLEDNSMIQCDSCHQDAKQGHYDKSMLQIPQ